MISQPLTGKTAFVSGSGRNIGRAIAVDLAKQGCNVVINGSSNRAACEETEALVAAEGAKSLIVMGDMGQRETIDRIVSESLAAFGSVDILVNNAAIRPHKPFLESDDHDWFSVVDTSLTASYLLSRFFLPGMVDQGWGRIVSMTGMKAIKGYFEGAPISAAKHGIWGMTKALAQEFGPYGVTVNAISPGQIAVEGRDPNDPTKTKTIPAGHMGAPEDISAMVSFLVSDGGRFVNGQMIGVNGGEST